jgi:thioesterase domain-containing protein
MASPSTRALFARVSRYSERAIAPINNSAITNDPAAPAFYCVHSVSGVAGTDFLNLAESLEPSIRFYGIQAPVSLMQDMEFGKSVDSIAQFYADALVEFQPQGAFIVGGWSVGAVIALSIANNLRARGRDVGPLVAIDGAPENTSYALRRWQLAYWREVASNLFAWVKHADVVRKRNMYSLLLSVSNNVSAIGKGLLGLNRAQKLSGRYAIESLMDVSRFQPSHVSFINRLFVAALDYMAPNYPGDVVVYEAAVKPLLYLPQIGRIWRNLAARTEVVEIVGTHISMMREPYVGAMAKDLNPRILDFFRDHPAR